jgi:hypothetical protein
MSEEKTNEATAKRWDEHVPEGVIWGGEIQFNDSQGNKSPIYPYVITSGLLILWWDGGSEAWIEQEDPDIREAVLFNAFQEAAQIAGDLIAGKPLAEVPGASAIRSGATGKRIVNDGDVLISAAYVWRRWEPDQTVVGTLVPGMLERAVQVIQARSGIRAPHQP